MNGILFGSHHLEPAVNQEPVMSCENKIRSARDRVNRQRFSIGNNNIAINKNGVVTIPGPTHIARNMEATGRVVDAGA